MGIAVGIDVGSTTVKVVVKRNDDIIFKRYERHMSQVRQKTLEILMIAKESIGNELFTVAISGSAGLGLSESAEIPFVQEVFATGEVVKKEYPDTNVAIELGGEDAKILFFTGGFEERMNGSCAGGTGAFIDQMATLLNVTPIELDELALKATQKYTIASRCGVFAKSDIQPLINQGAKKEDIAASIFKSVVDQTITGLAQGRRIEGNVLFLGGPLHFFKSLRREFIESLSLSDRNATFPELGLYTVALGAALFSKKTAMADFESLTQKIKKASSGASSTRILSPLFENEKEYEDFEERHKKATVAYEDINTYKGNAYLGIDCGSTTTKLILITEDAKILYEYYTQNKQNPVDTVKEVLADVYSKCEDRIIIKGCVSTGYGEELVKNAFLFDAGLVETMAHFKAAKYFNPQVDFILDIGGQDIKCFKIENDVISSIMLNEACSSGCGSFISTFAHSMGYEVEEFAKRGLFAERPVDLGSRCTVFMNSSVKQAQKDGASVGDISAGISSSVIKNAVYKVIRAANVSELGQNIVVQGGTFYNNAVLRSFERELGREVVRPTIAGLMGAFGAALYAQELSPPESSVVSAEDLRNFSYTSKLSHCGLCTNRCALTINTFSDGHKFISGNKCERPLGKKGNNLPNIYKYKLEKIKSYKPIKGKRGKIGIPLGLNIYENLPFWHTFFTALDFEVVTSEVSSRNTYIKGQFSIPSDTVCYPAKLMHGHIENLIERGITNIFYPCLTYNFDERKSDNHFNCPVVAYYPELLNANVEALSKSDVHFIYPHLGIHLKSKFAEKIYHELHSVFPDISKDEIKNAAKRAYVEHDRYMKDIKKEGHKAIEYARKNNKKMIVLCGRPYHIDPEINHGIDSLISSFDIVILSEECVCDKVNPIKVNVLNQWTYHARLYNAAKYVRKQKDTELVQLVSFGCGIDAITTDEIKSILEKKRKIYTQLKIDEITNLGAVKIRIRSLLATALQRGDKNA